MENGEKLFVYSESSIGFSKSGYRKHKVENSQGTVRGGILISSVKKLAFSNSDFGMRIVEFKTFEKKKPSIAGCGMQNAKCGI